MGKLNKIKNEGHQIYNWAKEIFYINRSLTGPGTLETLNYIKSKIPNFKIHKIKSGTKVFDWIIPNEWIVNEAYIEDLNGNRVLDYKENNLHLVGYSIPINKIIKFDELRKKIHFIKNLPHAIPYRYSYYKKNWGFCIQYNQLKKFNKKLYKVVIDSKLKKGNMHFGDILIKGKTKKEILLSTYICHPSMGNNEVSGPVLLIKLANYIFSLNNLHYSYRLIFVPETIGAIAYIKKNLSSLKKNVVAGFVISCVGDNNNFTYLETKNKNTLSDKIARTAFSIKKIKFKDCSFLERGSDERQYNSPNVNLNVGSIMRTKYGNYKEYHTSLDNLNFISPEGFKGSYDIYKLTIDLFEMNRIYKTNTICEPFFSKYKLRSNNLGKNFSKKSLLVSNICAYLDGETDLVDISKILSTDIFEINNLIKELKFNKLIKLVS